MNDDNNQQQEEEHSNDDVNHHRRRSLDHYLEHERAPTEEIAEGEVNMNMAAYWQQRFDDESAHSHNTSLSGSFSHARRRICTSTSTSAALSTCRQEDEDENKHEQEEAVSTPSTSLEPANVSSSSASESTTTSGLGRSKSYNHQEHEELQKEQRQALRSNRNRLRATQSFDSQQAKQSVASASSCITGNGDCAADSSTSRASSNSRWATTNTSTSTSTSTNTSASASASTSTSATRTTANSIASPPSTTPSQAKHEEARIRRNLIAQGQGYNNNSNRSLNSKEEEARLRRTLLARSALHSTVGGSNGHDSRPNSTRTLQRSTDPPNTLTSSPATTPTSPQQEQDLYQLKIQEGLDRIRQVQQQVKALDNEHSTTGEDFTNNHSNNPDHSSPLPCPDCQASHEAFCRAHAHLQHCPGAYSVNGIHGGSLHTNTINNRHTRSLSPMPRCNYSSPSSTTPLNHAYHNSNHSDERATTPSSANQQHHHHDQYQHHPTQQHQHQHQHHPFDPLPLQQRQRQLSEGILAIAAIVVDDSIEHDLEQERELLTQKQQELAEREARLAEQAARLQAWELELERRQQQASQIMQMQMQMQMPPVVQAAEVLVMADGSSEQEELELEPEDGEESSSRPGAPTRSWSLFSSKSRSSHQQQRRRPPRRRRSSVGYYHSNSSTIHSSPSGNSNRQQRRGSFNQSMSTFGNSSIASFGFSSIGIGILADSFVGDDATNVTPPSFTGNTSGGGISLCHESHDSLSLSVFETAEVAPVSRAIIETAEVATVSRPSINGNNHYYHYRGHDCPDPFSPAEQPHNPVSIPEDSSPTMMPPLPRTITASTRFIIATDGNNSVDMATLAQVELGEGPLRFAPSPEEELSLEEQVAILSSRDRHVLRNIQQRWNDRHDKLLAKYGSKHEKSLPELSIQWHLRFCYLYAKQQKHFNPDGSHYYKSRFSEDRTWAAEKKLQKRFVGLNVFSLMEQLHTKTLFPVPGLKTSDGLNMFYMRPARYFPNQTSVRTIIDNQCYVMNTMLENNPQAQSQGIGFIACMDNWKMKNFDVNYCYQFMMGLQGFMVPVKTRLFLIVNPPSWFGAIWKIMKPMLLPSFRRLVKIVPESKIYKYLQPGYEQYLPDDMQTGLADTDAMVRDFISYRQFMERDRLRGFCSDAQDPNHDAASSRNQSDTMSQNGMDENRSVSSRYCGSDPIHDSIHSESGSSVGDPDFDTDEHDDDDASIHCDISDEEALEEEDMKQPASPSSDRTRRASDDRLDIRM